MLKLKANESGPSTDSAIVGGWSISDNAGQSPQTEQFLLNFVPLQSRLHQMCIVKNPFLRHGIFM